MSMCDVYVNRDESPALPHERDACGKIHGTIPRGKKKLLPSIGKNHGQDAINYRINFDTGRQENVGIGLATMIGEPCKTC